MSNYVSYESLQRRLADSQEQNARLRAAILDIDAHATGMGEDADGFVTGGYIISVGSLHRALGVVGHTAPLCRTCKPESHDCEPLFRRIGEQG